MFEIYSEMVSRTNYVTYEDIFHFREQNTCDINTAIFELSSPRQRSSTLYSSMDVAYGPSGCLKDNSYHSNVVKGQLDQHYWCGGQYMPSDPHNYNTYPSNPTNFLPHYVYPTNGCSYPIASRSYYQGMTGIESNTVPTGKLLEFEPSQYKNNHNEKSHKRNISELLRQEGHTSNRDDHLYRNGKDIRNWMYCDEEDGDSDRSAIAQKVCEEMMQVQLDDFPTRASKDMKRKEKRTLPRESSSSNYSNSMRSLGSHGSNETDVVANRSTKSNKMINNQSSIPEEKWECLACTFLNNPSAKICEICDKSRVQGNECLPLISGGRNCDTCTLVNERGEEKCRACGKCLKDSSTYI